MEDAMMTTRLSEFVSQINEDVRMADVIGDDWVHVSCLHCYFERRCFTGEYIEKLAAAAVKDEDDIKRLSKMAEAIKGNQPVSEEDKKWWTEFCR